MTSRAWSSSYKRLVPSSMSDFVVVPRSTMRLSLWCRVQVLVAVAHARYLARRDPQWLERRLRRISQKARPATISETFAAHQRVISVSTRCSGRWCLDRSIAVALLLRMRGAWPEWHTGVCLNPFRAHAWVAVNGKSVGEPDGLEENFHTLIRVAVNEE